MPSYIFTWTLLLSTDRAEPFPHPDPQVPLSRTTKWKETCPTHLGKQEHTPTSKQSRDNSLIGTGILHAARLAPEPPALLTWPHSPSFCAADHRLLFRKSLHNFLFSPNASMLCVNVLGDMAVSWHFHLLGRLGWGGKGAGGPIGAACQESLERSKNQIASLSQPASPHRETVVWKPME